MGGRKILKLELTADGGLWGVTQGENGGTLSWNRKDGGSFLAVQGLRLCLPMQGVRVQSLVGDHMSHSQKTKTKQKQYCNKFNQSFKNGPH